jgi:hypothetical protein
VRQHKVRVVQDLPADDILLVKRDDDEENASSDATTVAISED